jgi:ubiquinone/menaquinone biosynthesis C-methylase UbiE
VGVVSTPEPHEEVKDRARKSWSQGDYPQIARLIEPASRRLVDGCAISAGQEVLDVAAGSGNLAVLAAAEGASVVASDLTPAMLDLGRERSREQGVDIEWVEADAEQLPFEDGRFDCVASVFGAMLAPRPDVVAGELFRATRPGGTVGMANWTPEGFSGAMFERINTIVPRPDWMASPMEWGREDVVRQRFEGGAKAIEFERDAIPFRFASPDAMVEYMQNAGPQAAARQAMSEEQYSAMVEALKELIDGFNTSPDAVEIDSEYLIVVAHKRG